MKKLFNTLALASITLVVLAQMPKGNYGTFALTNATIETVAKGTIANGTMIIADGKIIAVGTNVPIPPGAKIIDCQGLHIYPGMIDSGTNLGISEIRSEPRTNDFNEIGDVIPQIKALTAVNPNSVLIPVTRVSGVTTVIASPEGGLLPGAAALINLYGYTPDQMFAGFEGVVMNFPSSSRRGFFDRRTDDDIKKDTEKNLKQLNEVWDKAVQYHKLDSATGGKMEYYPEMLAMLPVVRGQKTILVEANAAKDILAALKWIRERKVKKAILTGAAEGWRVAKEIAESKIPVITGPVIALPTREYDRYDQAYANAGLLKQAGVKVALRTNQTENVRNLPYMAGFAVAYGMNKRDALRAITLEPAEIFGVADQLGSIEVGKSATLFVCDGDPFETKTNVLHVFISGWQVPMVSRQTQLYEEFLKREPGVTRN